jgi:Zn-dependent protease
MQSVSIGHVRGIELRVHPTFGILLLWVIYEFGISGNPTMGSLLYGIVLMGLIFGCVILHELGHSLMAQEYGIRVRNITLFPFGGAAFIEQMPMRPRSEFMITIAGPAVNVAIAAALLPLLFFYGVINNHSFGDFFNDLDDVSLSGLLIYLFFANIMIVFFNLLPAFPMDGGRLLRAAMTKVIGRDRATSIAVGLGIGFALVMAGAGIWFGEITLPLMAMFIVIAAYGEGKAVRLESAMRRLRVGQFALWDSGGIHSHASLASALSGGPRDMVVTDDGQVVGMLWRRDVMTALNGGANGRIVSDLMDPEFLAVDIDDSVYDVQREMQAANMWAVPVTDNGHYRGVFTVERFVHVYRYLSAQSPERRRVASLRQQVENAFRGVR